MGIHLRHLTVRQLVAAAAIFCLALFAAGCGGGDDSRGTLPDADATGVASNNVVEATGAVSADVKAKQQALAKKAEKLKAEAKAEAAKPTPGNNTGDECGDFKGYTDVAVLGFGCSNAKKFLKAGDDQWATLSSNRTKVGDYLCARIKTTDSYLKFQCDNLGRSIQFTLPTG